MVLAGGCADSDPAPRPSPIEPLRIEVTQPHAILSVPDSLRLSATLLRGDAIVARAGFAWSSSDPAVVEVDTAGTVHARAAGFAFVRAALSGTVADAGIGVDVHILAGAGDIADCDRADDEATAALLDRIPGTVFTAGDNAYPDGTLEQYRTCYDPTWGRHKARTRPTSGNHDTPADYYTYFGPSAGNPGEGYYSYDLGAWHIVALNSNIPVDPGSAQERWLRQDLAANPRTCTLLYWHHPRFSSGTVASSTRLQPLWQVLSDADADVVVTGHSHTYERFAPLGDDGTLEPLEGTRQFVVGTGGGQAMDAFATIEANSEVRNNDTRGVLVLILYPARYEWRFLPAGGAGGTFSDVGSGDCH